MDHRWLTRATNMNFDIQYDYQIKYVPFGHQNNRVAKGSASTTVSIRDVDAADAPVVMKVCNRREHHKAAMDRFLAKEDGSPRMVRYMDGKHYLEACPASEYAALVNQSVESTILNHGFDYGFRRNFADRSPSVTIEKIMSGESRPLRSYTDDKGQSIADRLKKLSDLVFVTDGIVFEYTPEPVMYYGSREQAIAPRPERRDFLGDRYEGIWGKFHDYDHNTDEYVALKNIDPSGGGANVHFEVIDDIASNFDGDSRVVWNMVSDLSRHIGGESLLGAPKAFFEASCDLREAVTDADGRITPRLLAALEAVSVLEPGEETLRAEMARQAYFSDYRRMVPSEPARELFAKADKLRALVIDVSAKARAAIERWQQRPAGLFKEPLGANVTSAVYGSCKIFEVLSEGHAVDLAAMAGCQDLKSVRTAFHDSDSFLAMVPAARWVGSEKAVAVAAMKDGVMDVIASGYEKSPVQAFSDHAERFMEIAEDNDEILMPFRGGPSQ